MIVCLCICSTLIIHRLLRTIPIDHAVRLGTTEQPSLSLDLDRHILLIRVRTTSRTRTLIWRLQETEIDEAQLRSIATTFSSNGSGEKISAAETGPNNGTSMEGQRKTNSCTEVFWDKLGWEPEVQLFCALDTEPGRHYWSRIFLFSFKQSPGNSWLVFLVGNIMVVFLLKLTVKILFAFCRVFRAQRSANLLL